MNIHDCFLSTETALHLPFTVHPNLSLHSVVVLEPNAEETVDKLAWRRMKITVNMSLKGNEKSSFGRRTSSDEVDNINSSMYFSDCSSNLEAVSGTSRVKRTLDKTFRRLAWKTWTKLTNIPKIKRKKEVMLFGVNSWGHVSLEVEGICSLIHDWGSFSSWDAITKCYSNWECDIFVIDKCPVSCRITE